jgi:hypothetical protein
MKKFQLELLTVFHSQEVGVSLLNQQLSFFKSTIPLCTPFNRILQDFTTPKKLASLLNSANTRIHKDWKASVRYLLFYPQIGDLVWHSANVWVKPDISFLRELHFQEKIWNKPTDEEHAAWINPSVPSLGVDTEREFHPLVSSFHQTYKVDIINPLDSCTEHFS